MSLACLLAYLLATAPATMSASLGLCDSQCCDGKKSCPSDPSCCADKDDAARLPCCSDECPCHRDAIRPLTTNPAATGQRSQEQGDDRSCPGCPACPGKCHLCSMGNVPFCFTPSVVLLSLGCLGRVSADTLLQLWQPCPDELIRPPMC